MKRGGMSPATVALQQNNRLKKRLPLLAYGGLLKLVTAEEVAAKREKHKAIMPTWIEQMRNGHIKALERADFYLQVVIAAVDEDARTMQLLFDQRRVYPPSPEYTADFWWRMILKYAPEDAPAICPNRHYHATEAWRKMHQACPTCKGKIDYKPKILPIQYTLDLAS